MRAICVLLSLLLTGCHQKSNAAAGPLLQRGYLWQRHWSASVNSAVNEAQDKMDGLVILGAEIHWDERNPATIFPEIQWKSFQNSSKPIAIAIRLDPLSVIFSQTPSAKEYVLKTAQRLLYEASSEGIKVSELQLDYDCASSKLDDYRGLVEELKRAIFPIPLVITTLPAWLDQSTFRSLISAADGYVLQVHSVPTKSETGRESLCDPILAKKWVAKASRIALPFSVSLPTYHAIAGYNPSGKLLGVIMDSVQQSWPPGTKILDFTANPDEIADLVKEWKNERPAGLKELLWYRVPVSSDLENWRWPTLAAVMQGRRPNHLLSASVKGGDLLDIAIINKGEGEERLDCTVNITWMGADLVASDALAQWTLETQNDGATFRIVPGNQQRLLPGGKVDIGWLRFNKAPVINVYLKRDRK